MNCIDVCVCVCVCVCMYVCVCVYTTVHTQALFHCVLQLPVAVVHNHKPGMLVGAETHDEDPVKCVPERDRE